LDRHSNELAVLYSSLFVLYGYFKIRSFAGTVAHRNWADANQLAHFGKGVTIAGGGFAGAAAVIRSTAGRRG
jgi:hypothetical protein